MELCLRVDEWKGAFYCAATPLGAQMPDVQRRWLGRIVGQMQQTGLSSEVVEEMN